MNLYLLYKRNRGPGLYWASCILHGKVPPPPGYKFSKSLDFSRLESDFWPLPPKYENGHLQKPSNIKQIELLGARGSDLGAFGMTLWFNFSSNFMIEQNLLICNKYNAKCLFLHLKALYFSIKTHSQKYAFSRCLPGHPFG